MGWISRLNIIQHTKKRFVKPKLVKSESVASCRPADGEFFKTHAQYTPAKVGNRTVHTHFVIETRPLQKNMLYDDNGKINISMLRNHFYREGRLSLECALDLVKQAKELIKAEPNLLTIEAPVIVCGDVHGQFYDLLTIFDISKPIENNRYLFLGDYVDRGDFSCEILFFLLAHKLNYPDQFFFLRGNHESKMMTESMTFNLECDYKYKSLELLTEIHDLFDALPLAAVVEGNALGRFFCTHGGISPHLPRLSLYNEINRFMEPPSRGPMCDILWSDPLEEPQHPETMEKKKIRCMTFFDAFSYSLPTMMEVIVNILSELVVAVKEEDESSLPEEEKIDDQIFQTKLNAFKSQTEAKLKEKRELLALKKEIRQSQKMNQDWFDKVLLLDKKNEQKPRRATRPLSARPVNVRTVSETNIIH
ncbi:Serine/threonine-protein phosphatase [Entamoeba marina]